MTILGIFGTNDSRPDDGGGIFLVAAAVAVAAAAREQRSVESFIIST
jgi:hypothetical protein